jgi:hypothetical protein
LRGASALCGAAGRPCCASTGVASCAPDKAAASASAAKYLANKYLAKHPNGMVSACCVHMNFVLASLNRRATFSTLPASSRSRGFSPICNLARISITLNHIKASSPRLSRRPRVFFAPSKADRRGRDKPIGAKLRTHREIIASVCVSSPAKERVKHSALILRSAASCGASRRMAACSAVPAAILRDGRPKGRPPQDEGFHFFTHAKAGDSVTTGFRLGHSVVQLDRTVVTGSPGQSPDQVGGGR